MMSGHSSALVTPMRRISLVLPLRALYVAVVCLVTGLDARGQVTGPFRTTYWDIYFSI